MSRASSNSSILSLTETSFLRCQLGTKSHHHNAIKPPKPLKDSSKPATMTYTGHCLCKAVTYTIDADKPLITGYDHCDDCQRQSGSTYSLVAVFPKDKVKISGPTKSWAGKGSSGKAVHRIFCSECGSPIAHDPVSSKVLRGR